MSAVTSYTVCVQSACTHCLVFCDDYFAGDDSGASKTLKLVDPLDEENLEMYTLLERGKASSLLQLRLSRSLNCSRPVSSIS